MHLLHCLFLSQLCSKRLILSCYDVIMIPICYDVIIMILICYDVIIMILICSDVMQ